MSADRDNDQPSLPLDPSPGSKESIRATVIDFATRSKAIRRQRALKALAAMRRRPGRGPNGGAA